jgi:hypothetical protein
MIERAVRDIELFRRSVAESRRLGSRYRTNYPERELNQTGVCEMNRAKAFAATSATSPFGGRARHGGEPPTIIKGWIY